MTMPLSPDERRALAESHLFVCLVSPAWLTDAHAQAQAGYAQGLGLPFRVLLWPGVRLPEDAFAGVPDLEIAPHTTVEGDGAQVRRWIDAFRAREEAS
jgi:hypothetical protein